MISAALAQRPHQRIHPLQRRERGQRRGGRRLQVHRHTIRQLDGPLDVRILGAGQQLEVDVAAETVLLPHQFDRGQHLVHRPVRADHAGAEEKALHQAGAIHQVEAARQLIGRQVRAADVAAGPERTVVAVVLARAGLQDLEGGFALAVGGVEVRDAGQHARIGRRGGIRRKEAAAFGNNIRRRRAAIVVTGRVTQQVQLLAGVHSCLPPADLANLSHLVRPRLMTTALYEHLFKMSILKSFIS